MPLEPTVVLLMLLAAVLHATWNTLVKGSRDPLITQAVIMATGIVAAAIAAPFVPLPSRASWPFLALSTVAHSGYMAFLLLAYHRGDLSRVYPIARGMAPVLVAVLAFRLESENLGPREVAGVVLVSLGIFTLASISMVWIRPSGGRAWAIAIAE